MKYLANFKTFVDEIMLSNSRNYKLEILNKYKDNESVKYFLQQAFDPYIVFGISDKKLNKDVGEQSGVFWLDYPEDSVIFDYLAKHNTGTDVDIWTVQLYRKMHVVDACKELFDKIVTKNLILGISAATINKVFGKGTIREFNVMLANKYFDKPEVVDGKEFAITTKIDGMRCIMMRENGNVTFWSRQGQQIEGLVDLEDEARYFPDNICLDGELVAISDNPDTYKQTMKLARTKDTEKHGLRMVVFDYLPVIDFKNQSCKLDYNERRISLAKLFDFKHFTYFYKLPLLYTGTDVSKIVELLDEQTAKGEEGIMINIVDDVYAFNRTNSLLKVKKFQDTELEVLDFEEGINKLSGTLGALVCKYKDNICKVGSGFTDELRDAIWANKNEWLGKIITVKYFEESYDSKTGKPSLRFPIFLRVREDI